MKTILTLTIVLLASCITIHGQNGFRIEANIGPTLGDSKEYFSYALLGKLYYLWSVAENVTIGPTTGVLEFLGEGQNINGSECAFCSVPDAYIPIPIAGRIDLATAFSVGADIGYGLSGNAFGNGDGFYFRPMVTYRLKEKLALVGSYASITKSEENASMVALGIDFGL